MRKGSRVWRIDDDDIIGGTVLSISTRTHSVSVKWDDQPGHDDVVSLSHVGLSEKETVQVLLEARKSDMNRISALVDRLEIRLRSLK